jgi:hypothetical protein
LYAVIRNVPFVVSLSTYSSWNVLEDLGFLFDEALEIRDMIKGTHIPERIGGAAETKLGG